MIDTRGTETDPSGRSREAEATRARFDIVRLSAARVVVIVILSCLLRRFRAIVVLSGRLDRLARFVVVLAVVVVPRGLRDSIVHVHVFFRRRAVSGGCKTVACETIGVIFGGGLRNVLTSGRDWSVLAIIVIVVMVVIIIVINGRRGRGGLVRH